MEASAPRHEAEAAATGPTLAARSGALGWIGGLMGCFWESREELKCSRGARGCMEFWHQP